MENVNTEQKRMTLFIKQKTADGLTTATLDSYCYALKDYMQWLIRNHITVVTETDLNDYFIYLRGKRYSATTLRDKYAVLHAYYNYCVEKGLIFDSPLKLKKPPLPKERARCFTEEEISKIFNYYSDRSTFTKLRDYTIMCILFATGIRRSELLNITTVTGDFITVIGKGNKTRCVPVSGSLQSVLKPYITARNKLAICPYLIINKNGLQLKRDGLRAVFTRLSEGTGITGKRFSSHTWRHTYATMFLKFGGDIASLQRILGHSNLETTALYLNWDDNSAKAVNEKCNPLTRFKIFL